MGVNYSQWEFKWHFSRPTRGSRRSFGNFQIGIEVNRHPRFREYILCLLWFHVGVTWHRSAVIEAGTPVCRNADGTLRPADKHDRVFGVAISDSVKAGDSHFVDVNVSDHRVAKGKL